MEIVVKQDQVEVSLQALQRPLPDTVLAATFLRAGDPEEGPGGKNRAPRATLSPSFEGQELSLRNPQDTIYASLYNTFLLGWKFFQASNPLPFAAISLWPRGSSW